MEDLQRIWNDYARAYDHFYCESLKVIHDEIAKRMPNGDILDLGCGSGKLLGQLNNFKTYLGIDSNEAMLSFAKKKSMPNASFEKGDILDFEGENTFDGVAIVNVLYTLGEVSKVNKLLGKLEKRILSNEGVIGVTTLNYSFDNGRMDDMVDRETREQIKDESDEKMYQLFRTANEHLAKGNNSYSPLLISERQIQDQCSRIGFEVGDKVPIFEGMGDLYFLRR